MTFYPPAYPPVPSMEERLTLVESILSQHRRWWSEMDIASLSSEERKAFPKMVRAWLLSAAITQNNRRRIGIIIAITSATTTILVTVADIIVHVVVK